MVKSISIRNDREQTISKLSVKNFKKSCLETCLFEILLLYVDGSAGEGVPVFSADSYVREFSFHRMDEGVVEG